MGGRLLGEGDGGRSWEDMFDGLFTFWMEPFDGVRFDRTRVEDEQREEESRLHELDLIHGRRSEHLALR